MGYEYLKDKKQSDASSESDVALAIKEHYQPDSPAINYHKARQDCLSLAEKF